jgi:ferritin
MLSKTVHDAINEQVKNEIQSAYLYLSMSQHCESVNFQGFAHWLKLQWEEELSHAMKFVGYLNDCGGRAVLGTIEKPKADWSSMLTVFTDVLAHEKKVTAMINKIYALAVKENDYATQVELQWFIKEQVEEEKDAFAIVEQLKVIGEKGTALYMLDHQLGKRGK